jgi:hypothetical protein
MSYTTSYICIFPRSKPLHFVRAVVFAVTMTSYGLASAEQGPNGPPSQAGCDSVKKRTVTNWCRTTSFGESTSPTILLRNTGCKRILTTSALARAIRTRRSIASRYRLITIGKPGRKPSRRAAPSPDINLITKAEGVELPQGAGSADATSQDRTRSETRSGAINRLGPFAGANPRRVSEVALGQLSWPILGRAKNLSAAVLCVIQPLMRRLARPPSTPMICPVTHPASSERRTCVSAAMSSADPMRCSGCSC